MPHNLINLLPDEKIRALERVYVSRVFIFAAYLLVGIVVANAALLFPTHLLLSSQITAHEAALQQLNASSALVDEASFAIKLAALMKDASYIETLSVARPVGHLMSDVIGVTHKGISLTNISFQPQTGAKKESTLLLTGVAASRDTLRAYQVALQSDPSVQSATIPVSVFVSETKLPFTITLTLKPL